jgi:hypothetical protein
MADMMIPSWKKFVLVVLASVGAALSGTLEKLPPETVLHFVQVLVIAYLIADVVQKAIVCITSALVNKRKTE